MRLPWVADPVPYKQLDLLVADEKDGGRRAEIEKARAGVWRTVINPILEKKEATAQKLARELGYGSYVAMSEEIRRGQLRPFMVEGYRFLQATDGLFKELLAEVSQREMGMPASQLRRSDMSRLFKAPRLEKFFPADLGLSTFRAYLGGMGIDFKTVAGTEIKVDDSTNPLKEPRAQCWGLRVPADIRINVKPSSGLDSLGTLFHEGGHAIHFASTTTPIWEYHQLGPNTFTEAVGELFRYSWTDPVWLRRYRSFVEANNAEDRPQGSGDERPGHPRHRPAAALRRPLLPAPLRVREAGLRVGAPWRLARRCGRASTTSPPPTRWRCTGRSSPPPTASPSPRRTRSASAPTWTTPSTASTTRGASSSPT